MRGGFQSELKLLRADLLHFLSMIELELDFSEEDVSFANKEDLIKLVDKVEKKLISLKDSFKLGNAIKNGVPVAIVGKPNAGKSSLLNSLLNEDKAIVSNIPGTTRDAIEDTIFINGIKFRFIDTAGLRETSNEIEIKGIEITKEKILKSSVVIYLFDINDTSEKEILNDFKQFHNNDLKIILVRNKIDLNSKTKINLDNFKKYNIKSILEISAIDKDSVSIVRDKLSNEFGSDSSTSGVIVTNLRHYNALSESITAVEKVRKAVENEVPGDLLSIDLRNVIDSVGEITGEISNDEMLGNIFSNFCIGK
jgi:tRNA modification GTPase